MAREWHANGTRMDEMKGAVGEIIRVHAMS